MKPEEKFILLAELDSSHCELSHGPNFSPEDYPAVEYITIPLGDRELKEANTESEMVVPVCAECLQALAGNEWTLLFCLECSSSQWISQETARLRYENINTGAHYHILGLLGCPKCAKKIRGLYFLD